MNLAEVGVGVAMGQAQENQSGSGHGGPSGSAPSPRFFRGFPDSCSGGRGNQEVGVPHSVPDAATSHLCLRSLQWVCILLAVR